MNAPAFEVGEVVHTRIVTHAGHCRIPRYARGRVGTIERVHADYAVADEAAAAGTDAAARERVYTVRFFGAELWGDDADSAQTVSVDLWERYLRRPQEAVASNGATMHGAVADEWSR